MGHFEKEYFAEIWAAMAIGVSAIATEADRRNLVIILINLVGVIVFIIPHLAGVRLSFDKF